MIRGLGKKTLFSFLCLMACTIPCFAFWGKKKSKGKLIKAQKVKSIVDDVDNRIARTNFDKEIDQIIEKVLGSDYRRANVYDFYPLEIPANKSRSLSHHEQVKLMDYYNYARKDLENISQSKLLKVVELDFNLDHQKDFAVIVRDKKASLNMLAILNNEESLFISHFKADFIEKVNDGKFPTTVVYSRNKKKKINAPSMRIIAFDSLSQIMYFDQKSNSWENLNLQ